MLSPKTVIMRGSDKTNPTGSAQSDNKVVKEFKVEAKEFSFNPTEVRVKKDDTVRLVFVNSGAFSHNWTIPAFGAKTNTIGGGKSEIVEFVADKTGTFNFLCTINGHENMGLKGSLVVE